MTTQAIARLDLFIQDLQQKLDDAKRVREILVTNPSLTDMLIGTLAAPTLPQSSSESPQPHGKVPSGPTNGTHRKATGGPTTVRYFEAIRKFLLKGENAAKTIAEIVTGADIPHHAATHVLYRTHAHLFEKASNPEGGREKYWRLRNTEPSSPAEVGDSSSDLEEESRDVN